MAESDVSGPIRLALVDDYEVVLTGLAHMFDGYGDRAEIMQFAANERVMEEVDIVLYDTFAQGEADCDYIEVLIQNPHALRVVVYTWSFQQRLIDIALEKGASGYLSKTLPANELVDALVRIHGGEIVVSPVPGRVRATVGLNWPGRTEGLTDREAEIIALITQGKSNAEIAELTFLSMNTIKSYIRSAYRKIGVASRTLAVLWGIEHGFKPDHRRIDTWRHDA
ncbi:MAG: response regulator transcription factor [Actinomycetota bacterium]|nr:response regulator transcription factor [Actinomycetota bacterium]